MVSVIYYLYSYLKHSQFNTPVFEAERIWSDSVGTDMHHHLTVDND